MNAEILAVGTELLMGQIANTNAQYITKRLGEIGVNVYYHSVVGDNPERLQKSLKIALERVDLVVMTGGLGPTKDDLTKQAVADVLGRKLVLHEESLERITAFFSRVNRPMTANNANQAYFPEGSLILENNNGTAPGCLIRAGQKILVMLPGPPSEMKPMLEESFLPHLLEEDKSRLVSAYLRVFGVGESLLEERIIDLIDQQSNPTIATYAKEGEVTLRITAKSDSEERGRALLDPVVTEICSRLGDAVYSREDENLDELVGKLLIQKNCTIALAESCTGGLIAARLTNIPGISQVFPRGIVTYSNPSKIENLGVNSLTLDQYGAVSEETAREMAQGIRAHARTDLGLGITGVAGPGSSEGKPAGLVYVALADGEKVWCKPLNLWGNRNRVRHVATLHAFDLIRRYLLGLQME